jgi:polysaccharide biosynthesis/export protein
MFAAFFLIILALPWAAQGQQQITDEVLQKAAERTGLSKEQLLQMYQSSGAGTTSTPATEAPVGKTDVPPTPDTPPTEAKPPAELAPVEKPKPASSPVFGMDFFKLQPGVFTQSSFGPLPDDYLIGVGDEIVIDVWGDVELRLERVVDRDGTILIPRAGKVPCAGLTLAKLKRSIRDHLAPAYSGISLDSESGTTFLDVTLGKLHPIRVFVIGEATQQGAYDLTSLATVFTALYAAGGPSASGSMRRIRLIRGDKVLSEFDLYDYLLNGDRTKDVMLREYDTILIPLRGKTVQLTGEARRPYQFELKEGETLTSLLEFGGGLPSTAATDVIHVKRIIPPADRKPGEKDRTLIDVHLRAGTNETVDPAQQMMLDGDIVSVDAIGDMMVNWVEITGPIKQPGVYEYREGMDVVALIETAGKAWPDLLAERALIERLTPDNTYQSLSFSVGDLLAGKGEKVLLMPRDRVRLFSIWDVQDHYTISISGAVRKPGTSEFRDGMTLHDLVLTAGGLSESADSLVAFVSRLSRTEAASHDEKSAPERVWDVLSVPLGTDFLRTSQGFRLQPHDMVSIRRLPWWENPKSVTLRGEVLYPGLYTLLHSSERLSEIVARAGGLKPTAFPVGAKIYREKDATGNISIDLDCALAHSRGDCDLILVDGDTISVPGRPYTVKVVGFVGQTTSLVYENGKKPGYYVSRAGGFSEGADRWRTQVLYPNGSSKKIRRFWFDPNVVAGSTILVPMKAPQQKGDQLETLGKVSAILASLATVALVADRTTR